MFLMFDFISYCSNALTPYFFALANAYSLYCDDSGEVLP